ncbi:MAG TPA: 3-dehydroquinate synthase [Chitinophagaceae bacterium]|jgi:3-dehydroquinate synthase|nr:3-dehydroquinate synthase [Chitinophagaceae bacterium]
MDFLQQSFRVQFQYKVYFTEGLFDPANPVFRSFLEGERRVTAKKLLFVVDEGVLQAHPELPQQIAGYLRPLDGFEAIPDLVTAPGGESIKNDEGFIQRILDAVNRHGIDRHSYLVAIGGGSVLDAAGYAAAIAHRGVRHIRIPTTVLSQNDSGVGVKNGVNFFHKKNFLGTFAPPVAVFNDARFLTTLSDADWRSGMSEAVKVALIKDAPFFEWLEANATLLAARDLPAMQYLIRECARLHMEHIAGGDPFEQGSSRPLDFGHWSAHKLEQLTRFSIRHGEAVAMGIALDSVYSHLSGRLDAASLERILSLLRTLGFVLTHEQMIIRNEQSPLLAGLNEFREHLGGQLTIMLLRGIGSGEEVHELDADLLIRSSQQLQ